MRLLVAAGLALMLLPASSAIAEQACLVAAQVWNWKALDRRTLIVEDIAHHPFKVTLYGPCPGIDLNLRAAFLTRGNTALDCLRPGDEVIHRGYGAGNRCPIKSVEPYTPEMQKADAAAAAAAAGSTATPP